VRRHIKHHDKKPGDGKERKSLENQEEEKKVAQVTLQKEEEKNNKRIE